MDRQKMVSKDEVFRTLFNYLRQGKFEEGLDYARKNKRILLEDGALLGKTVLLVTWGSKGAQNLAGSTKEWQQSLDGILEGKQPKFDPAKADRKTLVEQKTVSNTSLRLAKEGDKVSETAFEVGIMCLAGKRVDEIRKYVESQGYGNIWEEENAKARKEVESLLEKSKPLSNQAEPVLSQVRIERTREQARDVSEGGTKYAYDSTEDYVEKNA